MATKQTARTRRSSYLIIPVSWGSDGKLWPCAQDDEKRCGFSVAFIRDAAVTVRLNRLMPSRAAAERFILEIMAMPPKQGSKLLRDALRDHAGLCRRCAKPLPAGHRSWRCPVCLAVEAKRTRDRKAARTQPVVSEGSKSQHHQAQMRAFAEFCGASLVRFVPREDGERYVLERNGKLIQIDAVSGRLTCKLLNNGT